MSKMKFIALALTMLGTATVAERVSAHATSIGYEGGGTPGSVIVWLGTYNHGTSSHHLEGSMNLVGVNGNPFASTTVAFTLGAGVGPSPTFTGGKPAGLVDGVTNFFTTCSPFPNPASQPLVGTDPMCFGGVDHWQGALFTGLTPGDYQFSWTPIANPSAEWSLGNPNMDGIFTITGDVLGCGQPGAPACDVPEPASIPLVGLGLLGMAVMLRRRWKAD
ncbi:PEP-CTERM sorting domain-containing protein [Denitromonas iodatirespirans]|uniref:PEP-CTERM sorting domain-containing protein n=1 Tax=Denitromonas iodatirespirans TaxID=2795389 RepID=A0A944D732_DENI1|nr:PEP-CTERM sorting domain-containing protein [Denitromonas iodatirespirans]MBT0961154.1 PEP-CTERM sorting domain-containing protein [Denitromonas iodatirespirans]